MKNDLIQCEYFKDERVLDTKLDFQKSETNARAHFKRIFRSLSNHNQLFNNVITVQSHKQQMHKAMTVNTMCNKYLMNATDFTLYFVVWLRTYERRQDFKMQNKKKETKKKKKR